VTYDKGHGRIEERSIWTSIELVGYSEFPHAQQVCRVEHKVYSLDGTPRTPEVLYSITSLTPSAADPARLLELHRGHWSIENKLHYVRDRTYDEDRSQVRKHGAPQVMASLRNLAISLLRLARASNIAAALRSCARKVRLTLRLLGL